MSKREIEREEIRRFLESLKFENALAITLTMKALSSGQVLDEISAGKNLKHVLNVINKKIYKNKYTRYKKRLKVFPVLEWSEGAEFHYHLTIERPETISLNEFKKLFKETWIGSHFGNLSNRFVEINDLSGWNRYITKFDHIRNQVDWENVAR